MQAYNNYYLEIGRFIGEFWVNGFIMCDMSTSMAIANNPKSSEEQITHNWLLINMTVE